MTIAQPSTMDQSALWNGAAGRGWVESQALLDQLYQPFEDLLVGAVSAERAECVLDVGCGTGSTTLALARRLGPGGKCVGVDISRPMLAAARDRGERESTAATFLLADAQTYAFARSGFDAIVSRFGVMFFDDPVVAFTNLRRAAKDGALLWFIAWRSPDENPFMTTAERAAAPLLPNLPVRKADQQGQFGFADRDRVRRVLEDSGWSEIDIEPLDVACTFPEKALVHFVTRLGPVGRVVQEMEEPARTRVIETARAAFEPWAHGSEVRFVSACWKVRARA